MEGCMNYVKSGAGRKGRSRLQRITCGILLVFAILSTGIARSSLAQYLYLDANNDGKASIEDRVQNAGQNSVDVWIQTNTDARGMDVRAPLGETEQITINGYEFTLKAEGGHVEFGDYTNLQGSMSLPLTAGKSDTEMHVGFVGPEILPPGKYRLGRFSYRVLDGSPRLTFTSTSSLDARFLTAFGSKRMGLDGDNTLKLGKLGDAKAVGDWTDAAGLEAASPLPPLAARTSATEKSEPFSASVRSDGHGHGLSLRVASTVSGKLGVRIFDVRGRLARTLVEAEAAPAGIREFSLASPSASGEALPSGIYFYRVTSSEGTLTGRFVLLR
jgi:hypothetical protein